MHEARRLISSSVLVALLALAAPEVRAQFAEGNSDRDGAVVPQFPVPPDSVSISNGGEGAVMIPLGVSPGIGGLAPRLALRYSSGAGDDGLGAGWTLELGYPDAIRRTTRYGVPRYDDGDVFTFNGQDLVRTGTTPRYRTRIDSFQKIERAGDGWVVTEKDGTQLRFGTTTDHQSRLAGKGAYAWHLSEVADTFGKSIAFDYEGPADARRLAAIRYTLAAGAAIGQEQKVLLVWQPRPDPRRASSYGAEIVRDQRLDRIETWSSAAPGQTPLRTYEMCYAGEGCSDVGAPARGHSLLAVLLQSTRDDTPVPPTRFRYQERVPGWAEGGPTSPFGFVHQWTINTLRAVDTGVRLADVNGDGFTDLVRGRVPTQAPFERVWLHEGAAGWRPAAAWQVPLEFVAVNGLNGDKDLGVQLVDVNGDGLPDLVRSMDVIKLSVPGTVEQTIREVRLNNGRGWNAPPDCGVPQPAGYCFPPLLRQQPGSSFPFREFQFVEVTDDLWSYAGGAQLADVNGDGLADLLTAREDRPRLVYLNNGRNGWDPAPEGSWVLPYDLVRHDNPGDTPVDNGARLLDLNADGLPDLVRAYNDQDRVAPDGPILEVRLNHGSGWSAPGGWTWPGSDTPNVATDDVYFGAVTRDQGLNRIYWDYGVQVVDVDGDRFPDIVRRVGTSAGKVYLNDQSGGFVASDWEVPVSLVAEIRTFDLGSFLVGNMDNGVRVADADGDGLADLVYGLFVNGTAQTPRTYLAHRGHADLLVEHTNTLGGRSEIAYGAVSGRGLPPGQMPFVRTVALSLTQDAGMDDPALASSYEYQQGFYDWRRRDFRGYGRVIETRGDDTRREKGFYLDEGRRGIQSGEMQRDADGTYYSAHPQNYTATADASGVYRTLLTNELIVQFHQDDQSKWVRRSIDYTHDAYGNVRTVRESDWGRMERVCTPPDIDRPAEAAADGSKRALAERPAPDPCRDEFRPGPVLRSVRTSYSAPNEDLWTVGLVCAVERFEGDLLAGAPRLSTDEFYYEDGQTRCAAVSQNRLTRKVQIDHRLEGLTLATGGPSITTSYQHDSFGNVVAETNGRGSVTTVEWTGNGNAFPYRTCREGLCRTTLYDRAQGRLLEDTDANANTTRYAYDGLGRLRRRHYPDDPPDDPSIEVSYRLQPLPALMRVEERLGDARTRFRYEYYDGLGRRKSEAAGFPRTEWTITAATRYDVRGRAHRVHVPYSCAEADPLDCPPGGAAFTSYAYEDDKVSATGLPGGGSTINFFEADQVYHTDENGVRSLRKYDGLGQLTAVTTDVDGVGPGPTRKTTLYEYDGLGGLRRSVDPEAAGGRGVESRFFYDGRGLLRGLTTPDGAQTVLRNGYQVWNDYDAQGNHTYHWSGTEAWRAQFDPLDRQTQLHLSRDAVTFPDPAESVRIYDFGPNAKGRLSFVVGWTPPATANQLEYDVRGRVTRETFYFQNLEPTLGTTSIEYRYDRENRLSAVRDPRGRWIRYERNLLGQVDGTPGRPAIHYADDPAKAIKDVEHDAAGRTTTVEYGNGLIDIYGYDPRGRMREIMGTGPFQVTYTYTGSRLTGETFWDGDTDVAYGYDALNRLTDAEGTIGSHPVALRYRYDASGNIDEISGTGATGVAYRYAPRSNRLAAVRFAGGSEVEVRHDQHGNLTELVDHVLAVYSRTYTYDAIGRLRGYETENRQGAMHYDGRGRKVRRFLPSGGVEIYFHALDGQVLATYEVAGNQRSWTTYIHADGKRLAYVDAHDRMAYVHADRLGSTRAVTADTPGPCTDAQGNPVTCRHHYLPYGQEIAAPRGGDNFRYTGQELEGDIYDYGARYYDPLLGRFLQLDSFLGRATDPRTLNRYSYALNSPTGYVDPSGNLALLTECPEEPCEDQDPPPPPLVSAETDATDTGNDPGQGPDPNMPVVELPAVEVIAPKELPPNTAWDGKAVVGLPDGISWNSSTGKYEADALRRLDMAINPFTWGKSVDEIVWNPNRPPTPEYLRYIDRAAYNRAALAATGSYVWDPNAPVFDNIINQALPALLAPWGYKAQGPAFNNSMIPKKAGTYQGWGPGWGPFAPFKPTTKKE